MHDGQLERFAGRKCRQQVDPLGEHDPIPRREVEGIDLFDTFHLEMTGEGCVDGGTSVRGRQRHVLIHRLVGEVVDQKIGVLAAQGIPEREYQRFVRATARAASDGRSAHRGR